MYRVAGAFAPGTDGFAPEGEGFALHGWVTLHNLMGCGAEIIAPAVLQTEGSNRVHCSAGFEDYHLISAQYGANLKGQFIFYGAITDIAEGKLIIPFAVSADSSLKAGFSISGGSSGAVCSLNALSDAKREGGLNVRGEIALNPLCGSLLLKSAVGENKPLTECSFRFLLNGRDLTDKIAGVDISFYGKDTFASFSAVIAAPTVKGDRAEFTVEGISYLFVIEKTKRDGKTTEISGRAAQILNEAPYSGYKEVFETNSSAAALAGDALWNLPDFNVPLVRRNYSETELLSELAEECGGEVRVCADGFVRAVNIYSPESCVVLKNYFEAERISEPAEASGVCVVWGSSAEPVIEHEKKAGAGSFADAFVYSDSEIKVSSDADLVRDLGRSVAEIEEKVLFRDGEGRTSYPVFRLKGGADAAKGRSVYKRTNGSLSEAVRYETLKHSFQLYCEAEKDAVLTACTVKNLHRAGSGGLLKELEQKYTADAWVAALRAENTYRSLGGGTYLEITHLFDPVIASGGALFLRTPAGDGCCVSSSVNISVYPLKIIQKTRLHIREKLNG